MTDKPLETQEKPEQAEQQLGSQPGQQEVKISCSRGLASWLGRHQVSLAFTSYQSGRLYLVGVDANGGVSFHERFLARAMGLYADPQRLLVSTLFQVWRFENIVCDHHKVEGSDRHYVPRIANTTGDLDIHDIGVLSDGRIIFVNTAYSCLAMLSGVHSFKPVWKPDFISKLAAEDRCHLNGMALDKDGVTHVTSVSKSDVVNGWRDRRWEGGCVIDARENKIVTENLSMPHSPRWHKDRLWVLNSGTGHLGFVDVGSGAFEPQTFLPGFLRGLAFHNNHAIVGLSLPRDQSSFADLPLDQELKNRDAEPWCGVQIVDLGSGDIVEWIRFDSIVTELFDVQVLPGVRRPTATGFLNEKLQSLVTIEPPQPEESTSTR